MGLQVRAEPTPNPNAMKFTADAPMFEGNGRMIAKKGDKPDHPLAAEILDIDGVDNIFGFQDFLTVNKTFDAEWDDLMPKIEEAFNNQD
jgi:hypothetical protein